MAIIAIMDIGKSNVKLSLVDAQSGDITFSATAGFTALEHDLYPQLDTAGIWNWYLDELSNISSTANITHIGVTAHGATAALLGVDDLALPVVDYEYTGPEEFTEQYDALCDPFEHTFSPKLPGGLNIGRQLYWQREKFPERFAAAQHLVPYAQYWTWRLTGVPVAEVSSIGSHSDLWFPVERTFSRFAVNQGFAGLFPEMRSADDIIGSPTSSFCQKTGIDPTCQVITGIHDSNASIMPHLKTRSDPFTVMSTGTWVIIFAVGAPLENMDASRDCTANVNIYSDPVACGRFMGGREFAEIAGSGATECSIDDLEFLLRNSIVALPEFARAGGPFRDCVGKIEILDPTLKPDTVLTPTQRFALATLYCALVSDVSLTLCGSLGDIIVEGAFSKNTLLLQCLSVFRTEQTIFSSDDTTGTTTGTAMLIADTIKPPQLSKLPSLPLPLQGALLSYRRLWTEQTAAH